MVVGTHSGSVSSVSFVSTGAMYALRVSVYVVVPIRTRLPESTVNSIRDMFSNDEAIRIFPVESVSEPLIRASAEVSLNASQSIVVPSSAAWCAGFTESTALNVMFTSMALFASMSTGEAGPENSIDIAVPIESEAFAEA